MNKFNVFALTLLAVASARADATLEQVIVRQQWPWSTDVKVEYKVSGVDPQHPVNIGVTAYNGGVQLDSSRLAESIRGDLYGVAADGIGEIIIDPVKAFGQEHVALANFKVKLTVTEADPSTSEVLYKIIDMTDPSTDGHPFPVTDVTRADLLNGKYGSIETDFNALGSGYTTSLTDVLIWTGVTNYPGAKTTKLVLRKIPAAGKTFTMGANGGNLGDNAKFEHSCTLTKDFYIGVFELTQEQYRRLAHSSWVQQGTTGIGETLPVGAAQYSVFQRVITENNSLNFNGAFSLNYPTEAQWEFACRAGTTSELYTGLNLTTPNLDAIGWVTGNSGGNTHEVGLKVPNAYGLYDMIGNVYEACCDNWSANAGVPGYSDGAAVTDPTGPATADADGKLAIRGGYYGVDNFLTTSAGRNGSAGNDKSFGFRLAFTAD